LNAGGNREGLNYQQLRSFCIPWPPPFIRAGIARILTTVDNLIEKTEALIAKYQAIKQGMMHDLFTRGVDEHGHLRPPYEQAPQLYKQSELGWIPKEWEVCRVDEVGSVKLGRQRSPKHQSGRFTTPYLRVANVFDGFIDYSDVLEMDFTPREKETYSLLPGDILLNEGQSLELVGRSAIYEGEPNRFCFQNTLIRFRAYTPHDARFCRGIFKYYIDIGRFMTIARQTTSVAHLGADRLAKLVFPCPNPDEQRRIADALLQHEKQCDIDRAYMNNLLQNKTGLMQDLLTGKVRVKVDEAEEVAAHA
jgi:type I restriction enzyme S subunit